MMHILLLGAGYAGLHAALQLDRLLTDQPGLMQVTLVDRHLYHQHVSLLHLAATGAGDPADVIIPLDSILQRRSIRFHRGEVARIEAPGRRVVLEDGLALPYDRLVVALGGQTSYKGVPGAAEHTWPLRTYDEALRLRDHVADCFGRAAQTQDAQERRVLLTFAIVGAGFTGCQLAGELEDYAARLSRAFGICRGEVRIALIDRSDLLLRQFGAWASSEAERVFARRGISLHLQTSVEQVEPGLLHLAGNRCIHAATIVWAAGIQAPPLLADSGLTTDASGRIIVDRYLRATGPDQSRIFAIGDCAHIPDPAGGTVPATASYAMRQGEHIARSLLAEATGTAPRMYEPLRLGHLVSLGPGAAIGNPLGVPTAGPPAALLKLAVEKWYLTTLW